MFSELELREGWATVGLLLAILLCVAWSIQTAEWAPGLYLLQGVVLVGGIIGMLLAKSRLPGRMAHPLAALAGFTWAAYVISRFLARSVGLSIELGVVEFEGQLVNWFFALFAGGSKGSVYMFLLLLALLLWWLAYVCAWAIFRWRRVWWAVILCGLALMLNVNEAPKNLTGFVVVFVLFALLLVVRTNLAAYQHEWKIARVGYSPELVYNFLRAGLIFTVMAIMLAWVAPEAVASRPMQEVWHKMGEPWRRLQDESSRVFPDLNYEDDRRYISFARAMRFGGAVDLSDTPVLDVRAPTGRYWRVMAFHEYTSDGWNNTDVDIIELEENERTLMTPGFELRREVTQTITLLQDLGPQKTIAAAGQPLRSGLPLKAVVTYVAQEEEDLRQLSDDSVLPPLPGDPSTLYSRDPLEAEDAYWVVSSVSRADQESLGQAGTDYPDWVVPRYLELPDSLPERVPLLAEEITAGLETPHEKALAIESYLREIPYTEQIDGPAPGQDGVDYFLFDAKEGYCDYYSSAMVVMLRSVGVPARYVRGYGQGTKEEGVYHILEMDGHAWPEVFFPNYGWIEFEPTAGEPVLVRPRSLDTGGSANSEGGFGDERGRDEMIDDLVDHGASGELYEPTPESFLQRAVRWGGLTLAFLAPGLAVVAVLMFRRHRRIEGLSVAERVYDDLVNGVRRLLKISPLAHQTPNEYGNAVAELLPAGRQPVERIVAAYVGYRFGGRTTDDGQVEAAWQETQRALWHGWLQRQGKRLRSLPRRVLPSMGHRTTFVPRE
jgi:transglutaminase-like putative cysteine protease